MAEDGFDNNPHLDAVREFANNEDAIVVALCNQIEAEIAQLDEEEKKQIFGGHGHE